jgi:hypothetical protein
MTDEKLNEWRLGVCTKNGFNYHGEITDVDVVIDLEKTWKNYWMFWWFFKKDFKYYKERFINAVMVCGLFLYNFTNHFIIFSFDIKLMLSAIFSNFQVKWKNQTKTF